MTQIVEAAGWETGRRCEWFHPGTYAIRIHWTTGATWKDQAMFNPLLALGESKLSTPFHALDLPPQSRDDHLRQAQTTSRRFRLEILHHRGTTTARAADTHASVRLNIWCCLMPQVEPPPIKVEI